MFTENLFRNFECFSILVKLVNLKKSQDENLRCLANLYIERLGKTLKFQIKVNTF